MKNLAHSSDNRPLDSGRSVGFEGCEVTSHIWGDLPKANGVPTSVGAPLESNTDIQWQRAPSCGGIAGAAGARGAEPPLGSGPLGQDAGKRSEDRCFYRARDYISIPQEKWLRELDQCSVDDEQIYEVIDAGCWPDGKPFGPQKKLELARQFGLWIAARNWLPEDSALSSLETCKQVHHKDKPQGWDSVSSYNLWRFRVFLEMEGQEISGRVKDRWLRCGSFQPLTCGDCAHTRTTGFSCEQSCCPWCARVAAAKHAKAISDVMETAELAKGYGWKVLTLTLRTPEEKNLDQLQSDYKRAREAWKNFRRRLQRRLKKDFGFEAVGGWGKWEVGDGNNVHLHVILSAPYLDQRWLSNLWEEVTGDSKIVWIEAVREGGSKSAVKEIAKYITKMGPLRSIGGLLDVWQCFKGSRSLNKFGWVYNYKAEVEDNFEGVECEKCGGKDWYTEETLHWMLHRLDRGSKSKRGPPDQSNRQNLENIKLPAIIIDGTWAQLQLAYVGA